MRPVLLDTVGIIAVWDQADQWHRAAAAVFAELLVDIRSMVLTTAVLSECGNAAARRPYRHRVTILRGQFRATRRLIEPTADDTEAAWAAYARGEAGGAGVVDQVSFAVMRRLGPADAFTNDQHFRAAGFRPLF